MSEVFTIRGGARWGYSWLASMGAMWPLATLHASFEGIKLGIHILFLELASLEFKREEITRIEKYNGIMSDGIAIKLGNPQVSTLRYLRNLEL